MAKCKKEGRNKFAAKVYASNGVKERNRFIRLLRQSRKHPNDAQVNEALVKAWEAVGKPRDLSAFE